MATQLQLRRGTEAENDAFTGAQGEVTVDTTNNQLRVHDGTTSGGYKVANIGDEASKDLDNLTTTGKANISTLGTYDENETYASGTVGAELAKIADKADAGTTLADYGITDGANTDLSNLTSAGSEVCAHNAMPSTRYNDLTLDASGTEYTAPADGYVCVQKFGDANQFIQITTGNFAVKSFAPNYNGAEVMIMCPVQKNQVYRISYDLTGTTSVFRFIYANGTA